MYLVNDFVCLKIKVAYIFQDFGLNLSYVPKESRLFGFRLD